jgi:uncharacterized protein YbjT (DUF2867 family)
MIESSGRRKEKQNMRHLILGGTGTVGSLVVSGLLAKKEDVRVLTRSSDKLGALPTGVTGVVGDLADPTTFGGIFNDYDTLFILNGVSPTELQEGLSAVAEARRTNAKRIVYVSVHEADRGMHVPHFGAKVVIEKAIKDSGIPYAILRPNNFFQNDVWFKDALMQMGVYPQPYGDKGVSRIDTRDIADAAINALITTDKALLNRTFNLVGSRPLNGSATAEIWTNVLGRKVQYAGNYLVSWGTQASQMMPAWMVYDFKLMFEMFQAQGLLGTETQLKETRAIVGHEPRRYEDFVSECVKLWS